MDDLDRRLAAHMLIGLDTSVWIYHLEANERYLHLTRQILNAIRSGQPRAVISVVTVMELNVQPYRLEQPALAVHYEAILTHFPHTRLIDVNRPIARRAAQLRATYGLHPADALHVATSLVTGATAWVTNDRALRRLAPHIEVLVLDDFLDTKH